MWSSPSPPAGVCRAKSDENWWLGAEGGGYLYYFFDQSLVGPSFGSLQATDILSDPSDEGKLDSLAHGIAGGESDKAKQSNIVWRDKAKRTKWLKLETSLSCRLPGETIAFNSKTKARHWSCATTPSLRIKRAIMGLCSYTLCLQGALCQGQVCLFLGCSELLGGKWLCWPPHPTLVTLGMDKRQSTRSSRAQGQPQLHVHPDIHLQVTA